MALEAYIRWNLVKQKGFGEPMQKSHSKESYTLRYAYVVSCGRMDFYVQLALPQYIRISYNVH